MNRWQRIPEDFRRFIWLFLTVVICALLVAEYSGVPDDDLRAGEVAPRTIKAPHTFQYTDVDGHQTRVDAASEAVDPVFVYRPDLALEVQARLTEGFAVGRLEQLRDGVTEEQVATRFLGALGVHIPPEEVRTLANAKFPSEAEELVGSLVRRSMTNYVVADRSELPSQRSRLTVIELRGEERREFTLTDISTITTPSEAREQMTLHLLESGPSAAPWSAAAGTLARSVVRQNLMYDELETRERRSAAAAAVTPAPMAIKRGTILFRQGDVLTDMDIARYQALLRSARPHAFWVEPLAVACFLVALLVALYSFGTGYIPGFSSKDRDLGAVAALLMVSTLLARIVVRSSEAIAGLVGMEAEASSIWFVVPVAGAVILVRLLVGIGWSVMFAVAASAVCGLLMELSALHVVYFLLSGITAAGSVDHTRERLAVLRAGVFVGLVNAIAALFVHFLQLYLGGSEIGLSSTIRPVWSMGFAFFGGIGSAFFVLGVTPLFETLGFVTDYRLMELANLNHPLLRQLMLRAPGSYHHSVVVGTLAEAGCEAIGANALQARVAAYFHDVGKAMKPQYFVENQRNSVNRHDSIDPLLSAKVIIGHVIDGGKMAKEHSLPQPILDNIYMHHGTGILQYFYAKSLELAEDPSTVREEDFRYPGPKPNNREAGIIMLADKVEAATRTIREPSEENIRAMISQIINSVMADGQFEDCPLTFKEIHTVANTFVQVLLGIHHQRIEYPATRSISRNETPAPIAARSSVITLELPSIKADEPDTASEEADPETDYESVNHLPRSG